MHAHLLGGAARRLPSVNRKPGAVQRRNVTDRSCQYGRRGGAGGARLGELELDIGSLAREGSIEQRVERERGGVGRDRDHVVELDAVAAAGIERKLGNLAA